MKKWQLHSSQQWSLTGQVKKHEIHLKIGKILFTVKVVHCNRLSRDTVKSPSVKIFKMQQLRVLNNLVQLTELSRSRIL